MNRLTISIEAYGEKHSAEMTDEATLPRVVKAFTNLIVSLGYPEKSVHELFKDGDPNMWDDAWSEAL